jgi:acetyltransferase-like isoleucine patch superfamily enzyme
MRQTYIDLTAQVHPTAVIRKGAVIRKDAFIGEGAFIREGADIGQGAVIRKDAFIGEGADIGQGAVIRKDAVIGEGAFIGEGADIGQGAVIRDGADIGQGAVIRDGADIGQGAVIRDGADIGQGAVIREDADATSDYAVIAARWRERYPDVPVIPDLDAQIAAVIAKDSAALDMSGWHTCETTHCRAGWAVTLAGEAGRELEARVGPATAGGRIYRVSTGRWPDFYAGKAEATADIQRWAAIDPLPDATR